MASNDIADLSTRFVQGLEKGDSDIVASVYAPDALLFPPGSDMVEGAGIRDFWQGAIDNGLTGSLETVAVEEHGDVAVEHGRFQLRVGTEEVDHGKYVVVHRRQPDGSWLMGLDIWNSSKPG